MEQMERLEPVGLIAGLDACGAELAEDYGRSRNEIEEAIRCELWLEAA